MREFATCCNIECTNPVENQDTGECASCGAARRKAERQAKKVTVAKPINKVSPKRAVQNAEFAKLKRQYLELYPVCEEEGCQCLSVDVHHQGGKEGERLLDVNFFIALCRDHHNYYTENSREAIEKGISVSRISKLR